MKERKLKRRPTKVEFLDYKINPEIDCNAGWTPNRYKNKLDGGADPWGKERGALKKMKANANKGCKANFKSIGGKIVKSNDTYVLTDNNLLKNLVLSSTELHPGKETRGHSHKGQEEVYIFVSGEATMQIDNEFYEASTGDIFLIEDGAFHKVINKTNKDVKFVCVFNGKRYDSK